MANHLDRGLMRRQATDPIHRRKRWGVEDSFKDDAIKALRVAMRMALEKGDHRAAASCVSTLASLEAQNQADEHLTARLEAGMEQQSNGPVTVIVERIRSYPAIGEGQTPRVPSRPVADDRQRPTLQRGDVRQTVGQDDDGRVPSV